MARFLANEGIDLFLVAFPGNGLDILSERLEGIGVRCRFLIADLRDPRARMRVAEEAEKQLGSIDLLINNAGIECSSFFHELPEQALRDILSVNLEAPMMLTRLFLPAMIAQRRGHIVNMSSLAGKAAPGFQEPYAATKAALVAFTSSLRAAYAGSGVSASVICPGFVEAGIYLRIKAKAKRKAPWILGSVPPESVARAVLRAVRRDLPEIVVNRWPVRPLLALSTLCPTLGEWILRQIGVHDLFRRVAETEKAGHSPQLWN